tara:strand:+ start:244 stop:1158 length:915 start_codon:yes stop_codon:yes gene_type:complete
MERELNRILKDMSESTAKSYRGSYLRLRKLLELKDKRKPIKKMSLKDVLTSIENVENPSTRHSVFVIAKKIFDYEKNKSDFDVVDKKIREDKRSLQVSKNGNLDKTLPTYKELKTAIKNEMNPKKFIVSFLMFKLTCRNMDIALADVHAKPKENYDENRNHLIVDGNKVIFIRNRYKTVKQYGQKKNVINVLKFTNMIKKFLGDAEKKALFSQRSGKEITGSSVASYLKKFIVLGLTEGQIVKIVLKRADESGSYNMLRNISNNRGTSISVLLSEYDVSNVKPPSTEITQEQTQDVKQEVEVES